MAVTLVALYFEKRETHEVKVRAFRRPKAGASDEIITGWCTQEE